ncbi:MAG: DUF364 domain-containing protein [Chloroflexota bacterium]|nr:DUF364 domain-containing protein [Chloroflexota bacterium]
MNIIERLLASLDADAPVGEVRVGACWTAVVLGTAPLRCGLASSLRNAGCEGPPVRDAGQLLERSALELATLLRSENLVEASIGMATVNALLEVDEEACVEINAEKVIIERGAGKKVAIVGHFPFIPRVQQAVGILWVLEQRPHGDDLPAEAASEVIPQADVVAITGTTLINHTFENLVTLCRPDAYVLVLGASAPLSPMLFDYGVDAVAGTRVVDVPAVLRAVSQGATFRQIPGKRLLTMTKMGSRMQSTR